MEKQPTSVIQKGVIITLLLIIFGLVIYFTDQMGNRAIGSLQYVILLGGIIWSCTSYANQMNANVTFGNVFAHGFKTTCVVAALISVWTFISMTLLFPEMGAKLLEITKRQMESQGNLTDEQVRQGLEVTKKFLSPPALIAVILFMFAIIGAISSLIGAAIAKKNPKSPFETQPT